MFVSKKENNNYQFENYNVQSAKWEVDDKLLDDVIRSCTIVNASLPIGKFIHMHFQRFTNRVRVNGCLSVCSKGIS